MIMHNTLLGPYGKATVVLFTSQFETQLPKLAQLKKQLGISDGKYFSSNGNFDLPIAALDEALATARNGGRPLGIHRRAIACTHVLVTLADVHADLFALIKYSADLLEGFNLTEPAIKELTDLLNRRRHIAWMRHACSDWTETLTKHIARAYGSVMADMALMSTFKMLGSVKPKSCALAMCLVNVSVQSLHA